MPASGFSVIQLSHTGKFASFFSSVVFVVVAGRSFFVPQVTFDELQFLALVH